jgi:hypothetical protein
MEVVRLSAFLVGVGRKLSRAAEFLDIQVWGEIGEVCESSGDKRTVFQLNPHLLPAFRSLSSPEFSHTAWYN